MKGLLISVVGLSSVVFLCTFCVVEAGPPCYPPPIKIRPDACCDLPKFEKEEKIIEECAKVYGAQAARLMTDKSPGPKRGCCLAECIFNGTGHADLNLDASDEETMKAIDEKGLTPEWVPIFKSMAKVCSAEGKKHMEEHEAGFKLPPLDPADKVCHPKYGFALMCSVKELISNCPSIKDTPECKELQEFSRTCEL